MPILFETEWFVWEVENDHSSRGSENRKFHKGVWDRDDWTINEHSMERGLTLLAQRCMEENLEIKSVLPLNGAHSHNYSHADSHSYTSQSGGGGAGWGWGLGYGWGVTLCKGFVALLQRRVEVRTEDYEARLQANRLKARIAEKSRLIRELSTRAQASPEVQKKTEKQGLIGKKETWLVGDEKFKSEAEATAFAQSLAEQQIVDVQQPIEATSAEIEALQAELATLTEKASEGAS
ncbi:MAG: hypothetical protein CMP06_03225 [Xanthomonadales bacterium]|jgi:hypothetical protein|nr:hypothetical protein [Xanthomonadales bacterium]